MATENAGLTAHINAFICTAIMFARRLGIGSAGGPAPCSGGHSCPEVLEMTTGDFAIIGVDITAEAANALPLGTGCGSGERIVRIPRRLLVEACRDLPEMS